MKLKQWTKEQFEEAAANAVVSDVSIDKLINDGLQILSREVKNLLISSAKGKLDPAAARDLRDHLKLLFELKDREVDWLKNLSDDQVKQLAQRILEVQEETK